jgi:nicotinate-nucleotide adenylyltransferase
MDNFNLHGYKKIAIMGGTFDPIHNGHLVAAEAVRDELGIEKIVFMPTGNPPHKQGIGITDALTRYVMTVLATSSNPYFCVSRIETDRAGMSYTIDTIKALRKLCDKDCEVYFITGADAIEELPTWHKPDELMKICKFIGVTRPGIKPHNMKDSIKELEEKYGADIRFLEVPALAISSTDIRNRVFAGKTISYLVPTSVGGHIHKEELYTDGGDIHINGIDLDKIKKRLHYELSPKRFLHTRGVAEEARKLAEVYDADKAAAYLAGLLHDCAKDLGKARSFELCEEYNVELDEVLREQPDLIHSFLGAAVAKHEYGIDDEDILSAIKYHTTGRENMSTLEKIIYLADFFEPSRKPFDGIEQMRALAYSNLDAAMDFALNHTIDYNTKKNRLIHPLSLEAALYYSGKS